MRDRTAHVERDSERVVSESGHCSLRTSLVCMKTLPVNSKSFHELQVFVHRERSGVSGKLVSERLSRGNRAGTKDLETMSSCLELMSYLNLKRRVGAWCLPARARERSVNIEPRAAAGAPGPERRE